MEQHIKRMQKGASLLSVGALLLSLASSAPVLATPPATHSIATCADLNALGADSSTAADTIDLTADLDCTGVSFGSMYAGGFSGTLDGQGHSISHLTINSPGTYYNGLFSNTDGATIEDLILASGSVTGSNGTGALIGSAKNTTITNVTSAVAVNSVNDLVGGLIGQLQAGGTTLIQDVAVSGDITVVGGGGMMGGGTGVAGIVGYMAVNNGDSVTLRRVSYSGALSATGGSRSGGLIGVAFVTGNSAAAALTIEDSYNAGTVNTTENEVGGILGSAIAIGNGVTSYITVNRSYNSGHVTGTDGVGGIFGIANSTHTGDVITISDSFSAGTVTATVANGGGLVGANSADPPTVLTTTNDYFDGPGTGQTNCAGLLAPTGACTRIDTATTPGYFKANHTNAPMNSWDFTAVWTTRPGDYPALIPTDDGDNVLAADEEAAPNAGDANADGIADAAQPNVASFPDPVSGHYAVLQSSCGSLFNVQVGGESGTAGQADVAYNYPGGLVQFVATNCTPGATATITQHFYGLTDPTAYAMRKWHDNAYTTVSGAVFSAVTIGGQPALKAVYQVTDGSALDDDNTADGTIVDPAGPAVLVVGVPNTGLGGQVGEH